MDRVAGVPGDPLTYYVAFSQGGVWKSENGGREWKPVFDDQPTNSIGSIAVAASDPNVVYVGSGEANIRGNVAFGTGIFKSVDAGKNWQQVWKTHGQIGTMAIDPKNSDIAFAAVLGSPFGPGKERGVYRTLDGGRSWQQVLFVDERTGASDVAFDPNNSHILYAGMWQSQRLPWTLLSGGPGERPVSIDRWGRILATTQGQGTARRGTGEKWACAWRRPTRRWSTPSSRPRTGGCSAPRTAGRSGNAPAPPTCSHSVRGITPA